MQDQNSFYFVQLKNKLYSTISIELGRFSDPMKFKNHLKTLITISDKQSNHSSKAKSVILLRIERNTSDWMNSAKLEHSGKA